MRQPADRRRSGPVPKCPKPLRVRAARLATAVVAAVALSVTDRAAGAFDLDTTERPARADAVLVVKSERKLYLIADGRVFASLPVTFGAEPKGHKVQEGDGRTPEATTRWTGKTRTAGTFSRSTCRTRTSATGRWRASAAWTRAAKS